MTRRPPISPLFPSPPLFRPRVLRLDADDLRASGVPRRDPADQSTSADRDQERVEGRGLSGELHGERALSEERLDLIEGVRSEEHTSELQSRLHLVCRLLLEN